MISRYPYLLRVLVCCSLDLTVWPRSLGGYEGSEREEGDERSYWMEKIYFEHIGLCLSVRSLT